MKFEIDARPCVCMHASCSCAALRGKHRRPTINSCRAHRPRRQCEVAMAGSAVGLTAVGAQPFLFVAESTLAAAIDEGQGAVLSFCIV